MTRTAVGADEPDRNPEFKALDAALNDDDTDPELYRLLGITPAGFAPLPTTCTEPDAS